MRSTMNSNPPAFPFQPATAHGELESPERGMTLRDYFAGQALAGMLATDRDYYDGLSPMWDWFARNCYEMADAMLAERGKAS